MEASAENPRKIIPFKLYEDVGVTSSLDNFQDLEDSEGYWSHLVVSAYQRAFNDCNDPVNLTGEPTRGITCNAYLFFSMGHFCHSAIYLETIRDIYATRLVDPNRRTFYQQEFRNDVDATVIHEIGHGPPKIDGIEHHDEGGMMREGGGEIDFTFRPHTIKRFRSTKSWSTQQ